MFLTESNSVLDSVLERRVRSGIVDRHPVELIRCINNSNWTWREPNTSVYGGGLGREIGGGEDASD